MVALSYDPVEVVAAFAARHAIGYPLLSDVGSRVIERLGLLHEELTARLGLYAVRSDHPRYRRVPYPGTFVIDSDGVVTEKHFEQHHLVRRTADWFLAEPEGAAVAASGGTGPVRVSLSVGDATYRPTQKLLVRAEVWIAPGFHAYADPAPEGMSPLHVQVDTPSGVTVEQQLPPPRGETHDEVGRVFPAYEGSVRWPIGLVVAKNVGDVRLRMRVRAQACTESLCEPPESIDVSVVLHGDDHVPPPADHPV